MESGSFSSYRAAGALGPQDPEDDSVPPPKPRDPLMNCPFCSSLLPTVPSEGLDVTCLGCSRTWYTTGSVEAPFASRPKKVRIVKPLMEGAKITECLVPEGGYTPEQIKQMEEHDLQNMMGTAGVDGKYGTIIAEKKQFNPGEPVFVLRATDPMTPGALREYLSLCSMLRCSEVFLTAVLGEIKRIQDWQKANPALVKAKPD